MEEGNRTPASTNRTLNLYRYFRSSDQTFANLAAGTLFAHITTGAEGEELLARNVVDMRINPISTISGEWTDFAPSSDEPLPAIIEITLSAIGQETARKLGSTEERLAPTCLCRERGDSYDSYQRGTLIKKEGNLETCLQTVVLGQQGGFAYYDAARHRRSQHDHPAHSCKACRLSG